MINCKKRSDQVLPGGSIMRALSFLLVALTAVAARAEDAAPPTKVPLPAARAVKVEFYWGEAKPVPGLTADEGIIWGEGGEKMYLHLQPILANQDVVKLEINKVVFGGTAVANEQFTVNFHLTKGARRRLAETCGPSGDKMLTAVVDGKSYGSPYYLKSRDEATFVPYAGMFSSKATVDLIVATFATAAEDSEESALPAQKQTPAKPEIKVELRWAEFKPVPGVTEDKGVPFGEGDAPLIYYHKQAVLTNEDIAEARLEAEFTVGTGDTAMKLHSVNLYFTKEGKQKLAKSGEPGKKKLLGTLLDGRDTSTFYVDVADLSKFVQPVGFYAKKDAERIVQGIKPPAVPAAKP